MMSIKEIGDKILTAHVNENHQEVADSWVSFARSTDAERVVELHGYNNPSITDVSIGPAVVKAVNSLREQEKANALGDKLSKSLTNKES